MNEEIAAEILSDDQLHRQVALGNHTAELAEHPAFSVIMDILKREADEANEKLKIEEDIKEIKRLQNVIWRHDEFASKMYTLISMGQMALEELRDGGQSLD